MLDVELRDALARHAHTLDDRAPAITVDEVEARPVPVVLRRAGRTTARGAVALTVVVAIVAAVALIRDAPDTRAPTRPAGPDASQISKYGWTELPASPSPARLDAATVWTGREMIVWGGFTPTPNSVVSKVGTAFDPRTDTWRVIAQSPLSPRRDAAAVWTGKVMFLWGGTGPAIDDTLADGAIYDPRENSWRALPASPLTARSGAQAVWTGHEVIVIGGFRRLGTPGRSVAAIDAAAYDPASRRWRRLPALPPLEDALREGTYDTRSVWIGSRLLAWQYGVTYSNDPDSLPEPAGIDLASYSPRTNRWRRIPPAKGAPGSLYDPIWTGHEVVVPPGSTWSPTPGYQGAGPGAVYEPGSNRWRRLPSSPLNDAPGPAVWTGRALVVFNSTTTDGGAGIIPGDGATLDVPAARWYRLPRASDWFAGGQQATMVWTGHEVLIPDALVTRAGGNGVLLLGVGGLRLGP